ncbi:MAG: EutN/CcmL family microcompartment protein [Candidatus Hydrogenedentota bacterium]
MFFAKVIGNVVATKKNENLKGRRLLLVQPVDENMKPRGDPVIALDWLGTDEDELVFIVQGREAVYEESMKVMIPADAGIFGIIDSVDTKDKNLYRKH